jgi:hypothetical protein
MGHPNRSWRVDETYVRVADGTIYAAPLIPAVAESGSDCGQRLSSASERRDWSQEHTKRTFVRNPPKYCVCLFVVRKFIMVRLVPLVRGRGMVQLANRLRPCGSGYAPTHNARYAVRTRVHDQTIHGHGNHDSFRPGQPPTPTAGMRTLYQNLLKQELDVVQHVPIHGRVGMNDEFLRIVGKSGAKSN